MNVRSACASLLLTIAAATSAGCEALSRQSSLDGAIENGTYTSSDSRISVHVPPSDAAHEWQELNIKEVHSSDEEYVSFGPAAFDPRIFRLGITWWPAVGPRPKTFDEVAPRFLARYIEQLQGYGSGPTILSSGTDIIGGRKAYKWQLGQDVESGVVLKNRPTTMRHEVWCIDTEVAVAMVCVQWYLDPPDHRDSVAEARQFAESVVVR